MSTKEATITLRVATRLKRDFDLSCENADTNSSNALRRFMREFVSNEFDKKCKKIRLDEGLEKSSVHTDARTGMLFSPTEAEDVKAVKRTIALLDAFENRHAVRIMKYSDREAAKAAGRQEACDPNMSLTQKVLGAEKVIQAHFSRSVMDSLNTDEPFSYLDHPGFEEYAQHYIASDYPSTAHYDRDVVEALHTKYPPPQTELRIRKGTSYWK